MTDRWYGNFRQLWIAEMLSIYGFINREHLMRKFGISTPQASLDLRTYQQNNPRQIEYNASAKRYEVRQ